VGAHILSGAVLDTSGLDALIPDWKAKGAPITVPVKEDNFYMLGEAGKEAIAKYDLAADSDVQKYGLGMKEIWEIDPAH